MCQLAAGLVACAFKHNEQNRWNETKQQQKSMSFFLQNWKAFNVSLLSWYAMPGHLWGSDWWWQDYEYEIIIDRITEGYMQRVST